MTILYMRSEKENQAVIKKDSHFLEVWKVFGIFFLHRILVLVQNFYFYRYIFFSILREV